MTSCAQGGLIGLPQGFAKYAGRAFADYYDAPDVGEVSILTGSDAIFGDSVAYTIPSVPGAYATVITSEGLVIIQSGSDESRQILSADLYRFILRAWTGDAAIAINDQAPVAFFDLGLDRIYPTGDDPADEDLSLWFADPEADTLEFTLSPDSPDALPAWISLVGSVLTITDPITPQSIDLLFRATDPYGAYAETAFRAVSASQVLVPDVEFILANEAEDALAAVGLVVNYAESQYSLEDANTILSQDPDAGTLVDAGSSVTLVRSLGPVPDLVSTVPWLLGHTQNVVSARLNAEHLLVHFNIEDFPLEGSATAQDFPGGTVLPRGSTVTVVMGGALNTSRQQRNRGAVPYGAPDRI